MQLVQCEACWQQTAIRFYSDATNEPLCPKCAHALAMATPGIQVREVYGNHPVMAKVHVKRIFGIKVKTVKVLYIKATDTEVAVK